MTFSRKQIAIIGTLVLAIGGVGWGIWSSIAAVRVEEDLVVSVALAEGSLLHGFEESRREFLSEFASATANADAEERKRILGHKLNSDLEIQKALAALASLELPDNPRADIADYQQKWQTYLSQRDAATQLILAPPPESPKNNKPKEQLQPDNAAATFDPAASALQQVRTQLDAFLTAQAQQVRMALWSLVGKFALLVMGLSWVALSFFRNYRSVRDQQLAQVAEEARLEADRGRVLELTGMNEPLQTVLESWCKMVQGQLPGAIAGVSIFHKGDLKELISLDLPKDFIERQSCLRHRSELATNRLAVDSGEPVYSLIELDPAWHTLRGNAFRHKLLACWSYPIFSSLGHVLGTVDLYFLTARKPDEREQSILRNAAAVAGIGVDHRRLYEELSWQAQRDPLTELPNRRLLQDRLEQVIALARSAGHVVAVLMIDLDRFKQVNDLSGHRAGDFVLRTVTQRLLQVAWHSDTVARVGGDEFTLVLSKVANEQGAQQTAQRILEAIVQPIVFDEREIHISASIGISLFPNDGEDTTSLIRNADLALYQVKSTGRNGCQLYRSQMGAVLLRRMSVEKALAQAINNREFHLFYQPQMNMQLELTGMEALIRWTNPDLGRMSPVDFIPIAEETGMILPIGAWALEEACRQVGEWRKANYPRIKMAVNISARQLADPNLVPFVRRVLQESRLPSGLVELELTESTLMERVEDFLPRLNQLRDLGITLAIDDFGTGYSSLSYLQRLPVSKVKIDQSFVREITADCKSTIPVIQAIIGLAHGMGLTVVAEGVETERQLHTLRVLGCDVVQGYLIRRPGSPEELDSFFTGPNLQGLLDLERSVRTEGVGAPVEREIPRPESVANNAARRVIAMLGDRRPES